MYRIVCESLERFKSDFENREDQSRYKCMIPLELITDVNFYKSEKNQESLKYKKLSDFYGESRKLKIVIQSFQHYYGLLSQEV